VLVTSQRGQASVELVAVVPLVLLAALAAWQLALTGHTLWLAAGAARTAARADVVGRSPIAAARSALPRSLERGLEVERVGGRAGVRVSLAIPMIVESWHAPVRVSATASLGGRP
jgi:hypothetical protein